MANNTMNQPQVKPQTSNNAMAHQMFSGMLLQGGINALLSPLNTYSNILNFKGDVKQGIQSMNNAMEDSKSNMEKVGKEARNFMGMQTATLLSRGVGGGDVGALITGTSNTAKLELQEIKDNWDRYSQDIINQIKQQAKMVRTSAVIGAIGGMVNMGIAGAGYYYTK